MVEIAAQGMSTLAMAPAAAPNPKIVYSVQILRGVAATLVLIRHAAKFAHPHAPFPVGQAGVDIFFAISGIVIYLTSRKLSWHVFLRRRFARIVPLYWLATIAALSSAMLAGSLYTAHGVANISNTVASFLFIPAFDGEGRAFPPIVAGWTLNYEMYFYAICAVALALPARLFASVVTAVIVLGVAIGGALFWGVGGRPIWAPLYLLLPIPIEFLGGLWMARVWRAGVRTPMAVNAVLVVAAVAWLALAPTSEPYTPWRPLSWGIPAAAIVWAALSSEGFIPFARFRFGLLLGDASYALYLIHPIVLAAEFAVLHKLHLHLPDAVELLGALATCIAAGIVVHLVVEQRLVRLASWMMGLGNRSPAPAALESSTAAA